MKFIQPKIKLDGYVLVYHKIISNNINTYRCSSRRNCRFITHFNDEDLKNNTENLKPIKIIYSHTCRNNNIKKSVNEINDDKNNHSELKEKKLIQNNQNN